MRQVTWSQGIGHFGRDLRLGFRALRREPRFGASVVAVLALGIAASVTMFSVLHAVVLRPLPYARPGDLMMLSSHQMSTGQWDGTSIPNFLDWRAGASSFAGMSSFRRPQASRTTLAGADGAVRVQEGLVDAAFFDLLGTPPLLGRTFAQAEIERQERVVVISEGLWRERFAASPAALGRSLGIDGRDHVVIGVMPERFQLPTADTRLWRPLSVTGAWWQAAATARDGDGFEVIGRLRPGARVEDARAQISVIAARLRAAYASNRNLDVRVEPLLDRVVDPRMRRNVWLGFAAVLLLLGVAGANAGGMLAARTAKRRGELLLRAALGAPRSRLIGQLLAESIGLWAMAAALGLLLAQGAIRVLLAYGPRALPRMNEIGIDAAVVTAALGVGLVVMLVAGTLPALLTASSTTAMEGGNRGTWSRRTLRLQDVLVVSQIACAVFLLVGAVLFARSFLRAQGEEAGFAAGHLLVVRIEGRAAAGFLPEMRDRLGRLPGVVAVGGIKQFFLRRNADQKVTVEGHEATGTEAAPRLAIDAVTPGYFHSMGIEVVEGRDFEQSDLTSGARASIVNETMARRFWPGQSPLGKRWFGGQTPPRDGRWNVVIGVVRDMRREGLDVTPIAAAFIPDMFSGNFDMTVLASTDPTGVASAVRAEIRAVDPALPVPELAWAGSSFAERLSGRRFQTQLLGVFTGIALILAAVGVHASLAYQVGARTREIGIRSALGEGRGSIVARFVGNGLRMALLGSALGLTAAAWAGRLLQGLLYETAATSAGSYAAAAAVVLLISTIAAWGPAWRAATINPIRVLRE